MQKISQILATLFFLFLLNGCYENDNLAAYLDQAQKCYDKGSYDDAITAWKSALALSPENPEIHFHLALAHQHRAQFDLSTQQARNAINTNYKVADAYFIIAQNEIFSGHFKSANEICEQIDKKLQDDYRVMILRGDLATVVGQYEKGGSLYQRAIEIEGDRSEAYFKMAANMLVRDELDAAEHYYAKGVKIDDKESLHYWLHRAEYQAMRGNSNEAEAAMKKALAIKPNSYFVKQKIVQHLLIFRKYEALIEFVSKSNLLSDENSAIQKIYAEALLNANYFEQMDSFLSSRQSLNDADWLLLLGKKHLLQGSFQFAISNFEQALEQRQNDPNAHYMLALAYLAANKENLSKRVLVQLLTIYPEMADAELALAGIYYKQEEYSLSINHLKRIINRAPSNWRAHIMLGNCMLAIDLHDAAQSQFQKALELEPQSMSARYYFALAKYQSGSVDDAIQLYRSILDSAPDMADAGLRLAQIMISEKRSGDAIEYFTLLANKNKDNGYLKYILGYVLQTDNQNEAAADYYRLAVKSNPEIVEGNKRIADMKADNAQKIKVIRDAIEKTPRSKELKAILAELYFADNELHLALEKTKDVYTLNPQDFSVANNLAWLYLELGINLNEAFDLARMAFEKEPENPYFAHTLGWAFHMKGLSNQAQWYLEESIKGIDNTIEDTSEKRRIKAIFSYHLGLTLVETAQLKAAKQKINFAVKTGLPTKYEKRARAVLEQI